MADATTLDFDSLRALVESLDHRPLFVTVSGAHLYGFPSPDSDMDLRGCHLLPLETVIGLSLSNETIERKLDLAGCEVELVSHDLGKYLRLLVKNNGYVLEQIFSPLIVFGREFLDQLRPVAARCINRNVYHHYRGFLHTQLKLLEREEPKKAKTLLYAYRVLLSGIHLLRTGEVEANLHRLKDLFGFGFIEELIARKQSGEWADALGLDWTFHAARLADLEAELSRAFEQSRLPSDVPRQIVNDFLVSHRLKGC
jgi:hypothetical protein